MANKIKFNDNVSVEVPNVTITNKLALSGENLFGYTSQMPKHLDENALFFVLEEPDKITFNISLPAINDSDLSVSFSDIAKGTTWSSWISTSTTNTKLGAIIYSSVAASNTQIRGYTKTITLTTDVQATIANIYQDNYSATSLVGKILIYFTWGETNYKGFVHNPMTEADCKSSDTLYHECTYIYETIS
jgi:hypothetical protein